MDNKQQKLTKALFKHKIGQGFCDGRLKEGGKTILIFASYNKRTVDTRDCVYCFFTAVSILLWRRLFVEIRRVCVLHSFCLSLAGSFNGTGNVLSLRHL